jgi:hypothetical protein
VTNEKNKKKPDAVLKVLIAGYATAILVLVSANVVRLVASESTLTLLTVLGLIAATVFGVLLIVSWFLTRFKVRIALILIAGSLLIIGYRHIFDPEPEFRLYEFTHSSELKTLEATLSSDHWPHNLNFVSLEDSSLSFPADTGLLRSLGVDWISTDSEIVLFGLINNEMMSFTDPILVYSRDTVADSAIKNIQAGHRQTADLAHLGGHWYCGGYFWD